MTNEYLSEGIFAVSFLFSLLLVSVLWWTASRPTPAAWFWKMLAAGWTLNFLGNLAWLVHDSIATESLSTLSWIDSFYLGRYLFIGLAFWYYPNPWPGRRGAELAAIILMAAGIAWLTFFQPMLASTGRSLTYFLGVAIYPILDVGLIYMAWIRWLHLTNIHLRPVIALIALALLAYGLANLINFNVRMISVEAASDLANLFWLLADVLTGLAVVRFLKQEKGPLL